MNYLFWAAVILALFHFLYEWAIAPAIRLKLKYRLFALRDQLRRAKLEMGSCFPDRHFCSLQDSLNVVIALVDKFDIGLIARARKLSADDPEFRKRCESRSQIMDDCRLEVAKSIRDQTTKLAMELLLVNCGAWVIYLLPIAVVVGGYSELKRCIPSLASISEPDLAKVTDLY